MDIYDQLEEEYESQKKNRPSLLLIEIITLILLALVVAGTLIWMGSPKKIIKDQIFDLSMKHWGRVYDRLYFDEENDRFLQKEMFISSMKLSDGTINTDRIRNIRIHEKEDHVYEVLYSSGKREVREEWKLKKKKGRWKIDGSEYVRDHIQIEVQRGTKVTFDGIELTKKLKEESYVIPHAFQGIHYITASAGHRKKYEDVVVFHGNDRYKISMEFNQATIENVGNKAVERLENIYEKTVEENENIISLELKNNKVSSIQTEENEIQVTILSDYELCYGQNKKYRKKYREGSCENKFIYSYKNRKFTLKDMETEDIFSQITQ